MTARHLAEENAWTGLTDLDLIAVLVTGVPACLLMTPRVRRRMGG